MVSGTNSQQDHGLGCPVQVRTKRSTITRSIYVSRLQPHVTQENILTFMKSKIPDLNSDDVYLRLLVKKDQNVEELNFVSYRLGCTTSLYTQLMDPSFWPSHIMIGDFVERQRVKQSELGDFLLLRQPQAPKTPIVLPTPTPSLTRSSTAAITIETGISTESSSMETETHSVSTIVDPFGH